MTFKLTSVEVVVLERNAVQFTHVVQAARCARFAASIARDPNARARLKDAAALVDEAIALEMRAAATS